MYTYLPLVTVITPSFNQGKFIERTILSVLKQDYPKIEYIVLDSLSADETPSILNKYRDKITHLIREKDQGQSHALNKGFAMAKGDILAYLNSDDCYANNSVISQVVQAFRNNPTYDVIYGRRYTIDDNGNYLHSYPFSQFDEELLYRSCYMTQETTFWTRRIYEKAGNFINEKYKFAMDYELWLRFLQHGATFLSLDALFGLFRLHDSGKTTTSWLDIGYPEARQIQKEYGSCTRHLSEMYDFHHQYIFGVNRNKQPRSVRLVGSLWQSQIKVNQTLLGAAPLDHWVYQAFPMTHEKARSSIGI